MTTRFRGQVETAVRRLLKTMDVPAQQAVTHRWVESRLKGLSVCVSAPPEDTDPETAQSLGRARAGSLVCLS